MLTNFKTPHETSWRSRHTADTERRSTDHYRPSGRLGGPGVPTFGGDDLISPSVGMESYSAVVSFGETLNRLRSALSRSGFEILRESDVGSRIRRRPGGNSKPQCQIVYVTDPELFETAISTHASAALWLPIPLVVRAREDSVAILVPAELIVRDRAALLGLRLLVAQAYQRLRTALETLATRDSRADFG